MLTNRPEFAWVDAGAMHLGAIEVSIYKTSSPDRIEYLFGNAEHKIAVTETALLPAILKPIDEKYPNEMEGLYA